MWPFVIALVGWIWDGIQAAADYVVIALQYAYFALKAGLGAVWDAARFIYSDILKPIGEFLNDAYQRLKTLYDKLLKPVLDWATRLTKALRLVYTTFVQPILSALDGARKVLQLLELLHVAWAKQLDDALANLEHKIAAPLLLAIQVVNAIDSRIESYILTADNLFRRATLIGSIQRNLNSIANMQWNRGLSTLTPDMRHQWNGANLLADADEHVALLESALSDDDVGPGIDIPGAVQLLDDQLAVA